ASSPAARYAFRAASTAWTGSEARASGVGGESTGVALGNGADIPSAGGVVVGPDSIAGTAFIGTRGVVAFGAAEYGLPGAAAPVGGKDAGAGPAGGWFPPPGLGR